VEEQELRFSQSEVLMLQSLVAKGARQDLVGQLMARFDGHPALTSVMLRHLGLDDELNPPKDLVWYADRLTTALSCQALVLLYVAALLREDSTKTLRSCLPLGVGDEGWAEAHSLSPLLVLSAPLLSEPGGFRMHAVLRSAVCREAKQRLTFEVLRDSRSDVLSYLLKARAFDRACHVLQSECEGLELSNWCEKYGTAIVRFVGPDAASALIDKLSPALLAGNPTLLLLRATILREQERFDEARESACLAANLAEADGSSALWVSSTLLIARLALDVGQLAGAKKALKLLNRCLARGESIDEDSERLIDIYMAIVEAETGQTVRAITRAERVMKSLDSIDDLGSDEAVFAVNGLAAVEGLCSGMWSAAAQLMSRLASRHDLSPSQRILVKANLASCELELGCLREAQLLLDRVIEDTEATGLHSLAAYARGTRSSVRYAAGDEAGGLNDYHISERVLGEIGHQGVRVAETLNAAINRRACGYRDEALALVEGIRFLAPNETSGLLLPADVKSLETAASHLSLGDPWAARKIVEEVKAGLANSTLNAHLWRADLILAEIERLDGATKDARERLAQHADYFLTGSANWLTAMYVRAFPGLLGVLVDAIGASELPLRMLMLLPEETLDLGIALASETLSGKDVAVLRGRRGGESAAAVGIMASQAGPSCYARLFGGLEVSTNTGVVSDESWRKRKARLMFLMLLLRQGQDIPRDVLLERLWPEMDDAQALRNFYVTWSTMKRALSCGGAPSEAKSFVHCASGVCRVTRHVRSDLDDFDEALAALRAASCRRDSSQVLAEARRLVDLYRGELLPGDLYEECFAETRDRTKQDFCDAMLLATAEAEANANTEEALVFLRKACAADPWREDVYQSMMRCQMRTGQRSRAIETYLSCRSRLTEDLGIDPSVETTRLYQIVLAMEEIGV
jgi:DNA-binding SARP family transcriptional activator